MSRNKLLGPNGAGQTTLMKIPATLLDPEERVRFHNLLSETAGEKTVVLLSTHIVSDVSHLCVGMAIIRRGGLFYLYLLSSNGWSVLRATFALALNIITGFLILTTR
jgi:ABC-type multidrug transport system ATPase subunit